MIDMNSLDYIHRCSKCGVEKPNSEYTRKNTDHRRRKFTSACRICENSRLNKYQKTSEQGRKHKIKYFFGLDYDDYLKMIEVQNNCCAICNISQEKLTKRMAIDHCHTTGKIRGLLCEKCNHGLGMFKDNTKFLKEAINYLEKQNTGTLPILELMKL